jgi:hypothetical protein
MAREIDREQVRRLMEQGAQIIDVLPARETTGRVSRTGWERACPPRGRTRSSRGWPT